jgi:broad specificity phosphatase PhoE
MIAVAVVRHGKDEGKFGSGDPCLTAEGKVEAMEAARELSSVPWRALVCSPAARAVQTAQLIGRELGLSPVPDPLFEELRPGSDLTGTRGEWQRGILDLPWEQVPAALRGWRDSLMSRIRGLREDTVIVTHFGTINAIVSPLAGSRTFFSFAPRTCSITRLAVRPGHGVAIEELGASKAGIS